MDISKLTEVSNSIYIMVARELQKRGLPATVGAIVVESVYRRIIEDAYTLVSVHNADVEAELKSKEKEIAELKAKLQKNDNNTVDSK